MPTPYKIEVFDRNITFKDFTPISDTPFNFDYLTLKKTVIVIPKINVARTDFIHVTDFKGNVRYQGIVDDVLVQKDTCKIVIVPLLRIFDIKVFFNRTYLLTGTLESFIGNIITAEYINNSDSLQNIPGLSVQTLTSTYNTSLNLESNVGELYSIISGALSAYGIIVTATLKPQAKAIEIKIGKPSAAPVKLEADLKNCIDPKFVIGDSLGAVNKMVLINQDDETERVTYYLTY